MQGRQTGMRRGKQVKQRTWRQVGIGGNGVERGKERKGKGKRKRQLKGRTRETANSTWLDRRQK